jgi:hypothetical protein
MSQLTMEQATQLWADYQKALLSYGCRLNISDDLARIQIVSLIAAELRKLKLEENLGNMLFITRNSLLEQLPWLPGYEPAKLKLKTQNQKPVTLPNPLKDEAEFTKKVRAGEAADAKKTVDDVSIAQARSIIEGFNPVKKGRYDNRLREDKQREWTTALDKAIQNKVNLQKFVEGLSLARSSEYERLEKASERL